MEIVSTLLIMILVGFGALLGAILLPWGSLAHSKRTVTAIFAGLAAAGIAIAFIYSLGFYRHGPDGGWWPLIAVLYSCLWALILAIALGFVKLASSLRRKARNEG